MKTSAPNARKWRLAARNCELTPTTEVKGDPVKGRLVFGPRPGHYHHIQVTKDGGFVVSPEAFLDDVVGFAMACASSNPKMDKEIIAKLAEVMDMLDARAMKRHGYKDSPEEAAVKWPKAE